MKQHTYLLIIWFFYYVFGQQIALSLQSPPHNSTMRLIDALNYVNSNYHTQILEEKNPIFFEEPKQTIDNILNNNTSDFIKTVFTKYDFPNPLQHLYQLIEKTQIVLNHELEATATPFWDYQSSYTTLLDPKIHGFIASGLRLKFQITFYDYQQNLTDEIKKVEEEEKIFIENNKIAELNLQIFILYIEYSFTQKNLKIYSQIHPLPYKNKKKYTSEEKIIQQIENTISQQKDFLSAKCIDLQTKITSLLGNSFLHPIPFKFNAHHSDLTKFLQKKSYEAIHQLHMILNPDFSKKETQKISFPYLDHIKKYENISNRFITLIQHQKEIGSQIQLSHEVGFSQDILPSLMDIEPNWKIQLNFQIPIWNNTINVLHEPDYQKIKNYKKNIAQQQKTLSTELHNLLFQLEKGSISDFHQTSDSELNKLEELIQNQQLIFWYKKIKHQILILTKFYYFKNQLTEWADILTSEI